jgi:hypothetical protein
LQPRLLLAAVFKACPCCLPVAVTVVMGASTGMSATDTLVMAASKAQACRSRLAGQSVSRAPKPAWWCPLTGMDGANLNEKRFFFSGGKRRNSSNKFGEKIERLNKLMEMYRYLLYRGQCARGRTPHGANLNEPWCGARTRLCVPARKPPRHHPTPVLVG